VHCINFPFAQGDAAITAIPVSPLGFHPLRTVVLEGIQGLVQAPTQLLDIEGAKPTAALKNLEEWINKEGRLEWQRQARTAAIMGSCPKSRAGFQSGLLHWLEYVRIAKGPDTQAFPVLIDDVVAWSMTFRCVGTFGNYLGHVRSACCAYGHDPPAVGHPAIKRAFAAIAKRLLFTARWVCCTRLCTNAAHVLWQAKNGDTAFDVEEHDGKVHFNAAWRVVAYCVHVVVARAIGSSSAHRVGCRTIGLSGGHLA
jgi:hypothetical protein